MNVHFSFRELMRRFCENVFGSFRMSEYIHDDERKKESEKKVRTEREKIK